MEKIKYLIEFQEIKDLSINELTNLLKSKRGLPINEMKISHLVYYNGEPIYSGNGVYFFRYQEKITYVGNCVARNFVERIPAHFDLRRWGWFNSLLKAIIKKDYKIVLTDDLHKQDFERAAREVFDKHELVLINFRDEDLPKDDDHKEEKRKKKNLLNQLENLLKIKLEPLNKFKHKKIPNGINTVKDYLDMK